MTVGELGALVGLLAGKLDALDGCDDLSAFVNAQACEAHLGGV